MPLKILNGIAVLLVSVALAILIAPNLFFSVIPDLRRSASPVESKCVNALPAVRDVYIPSGALTVAQGWSTTCTVTFVDGTTQVAVVSLAP